MWDCRNEFQRVLYQEISNVSPKYRGYGLQKTLATVVMENIDLEKYDYVCSTVKPYNIPSLKDKFSQDLVIKGLKIKYVDKLRYIFIKTYDKRCPRILLKTSDIDGRHNCATATFKTRFPWHVYV